MNINPGFAGARQDKPNPLMSVHQLRRARGGEETLRGSCSGEEQVTLYDS